MPSVNFTEDELREYLFAIGVVVGQLGVENPWSGALTELYNKLFGGEEWESGDV